jgi:hypothetical protein
VFENQINIRKDYSTHKGQKSFQGEKPMNRIKAIVLVSLLAMVGVLLIAGHALAAVVENVHDIPLSGAVFNPCNGETVTFTGVDHFTAKVTLDGAGGFHLDDHDNIHVTATGDQGNSYEGNQEDNAPLNGRVAMVQTLPLTFSEISKGSAPNSEVHALQHITVNANGTVTVFFSNFTSSCRG